MKIRLQSGDSFRIAADSKEDNFIDVNNFGYDCMSIDLFAYFQYIEIRRKDDRIRLFTFKKKSDKKDCDFGFWDDAEVVYSVNEQVMNKG